MAHFITITTPDGERFEVPTVKDPKSSRKAAARDERVADLDGFLDCGHVARVWVDGDEDTDGYWLDLANLDRHYRDGNGWQVDGERGSKDYAPTACLAVCSHCNQHGPKSDRLDQRLTRALVRVLRSTADALASA